MLSARPVRSSLVTLLIANLRLLGFDYEFGTLNENGQPNELAEAFESIFRTDLTVLQQMRGMLNDRFPIVRRMLVRNVSSYTETYLTDSSPVLGPN